MIRRSIPFGRHLLTSLFVGLLPLPLYAIDVQLKNGSIRTGDPDPSTSDSYLRVRTGGPNAHIIFGIRWEQIAEIRDGREVWKPEQFDELRKRWSEQISDRQESNEPERDDSARAENPSSSRPLWQAPATAGPTEPSNSRMRFIEIDAVAANWDAGVEWDGIVVRVWPMDQFGHVVRVPGTLEATLISEEPGFDDRWHGDDNQRIGHWVRPVRVSDYGHDGFNLRLEFQNYQPERPNAPWHPDYFIARHGEVHVSMIVPGHGVFRASTGPVRIRRFSPLRDKYFLRNGTRFHQYGW